MVLNSNITVFHSIPEYVFLLEIYFRSESDDSGFLHGRPISSATYTRKEQQTHAGKCS